MTQTRPGYFSEKVRNESFGLSLDTAKILAERIYAALLTYGDLSADQICQKINYSRVYVVHARLNDLMDDDLVVDTQKTVINTDTHKPNTLWHAVPREKIIQLQRTLL
jgi:hypothetical protein